MPERDLPHEVRQLGRAGRHAPFSFAGLFRRGSSLACLNSRASRWAIGFAGAILWSILGFAVAPAAAQNAVPCSFQYLLQNDPAYWSEASYTFHAECVKSLRAELQARSPPTPESKYLELHLARWDGDKAMIAGALTALCRDDGYGRACSAAADLLLEGASGSAPKAKELLELAAARQVPAAHISLGDMYLLRFRSGRDGRDLCRALKFWQSGKALGDPVGERRIGWVGAELKQNCAGS